MNLYNDSERFISILSDYGFKVTFGNETDTRFLRRALQALIQSPVAIAKVEFIESEIPGLTKDSRSGIYDIACVDETGNQFIVEMQLSKYPDFIQRMKFYSFYRLNTLIRKGRYKFEGLPKIYCIGILAANIFPHITDYQNVAVLRNDKGELIDEQTVFITVELAKFRKRLANVHTDLDKLIYTMKTTHRTTKPRQFPQFWNEEWLEAAINELDTRQMTPEKRMAYEMTLAANALAVQNEQRKIEEARQEENLAVKAQTVLRALKLGKLTIEEIAEYSGVSTDYVLEIQRSPNKAA
ncbi:Rpn family recombination-promoting nuclease/putative transposase [Fibrella aquatilis]|uniref:Rpn family recombination-promoting nuclease/putative transposase n=1 Tax=Fibrella aquatilis TaxID=2817059 RepID=A0A939JYP8_9BACT|nr:Rpn family recombination-promoting nuclease/putative transposase [Fibrella aquatilis]MBO0934222.1 Rpn family recombination-promoting nuclease/putative transposase [Fibrella aquatilis]